MYIKIIYFLFFFLLSTLLHADKNELEKISVQLQWKHQFEFAGFYIAKEKGFYEEVGLDVDFIEFSEKTDIVESVHNGNAHYALGYSSIIADYLNGSPIVFIANFFKQSPLVLVTQKNISSLSGLKGAKIEGLANNIHNITLYAMLNKFDISEKDIKTSEPSFSIDNFLKKDIDAMSVFTTNELYALDMAGAEYNIFDPVSYGEKYYDLNLFTSKKETLENPKRVESFKKASIKGWEYALKHKKETVELILQKYNTQNKSRKSLLFEAKQIEHIMLPSVYPIGSIDISRVNLIAESFIQSGFISRSVPKDLKDFVWGSHNTLEKITQSERRYLKEKKKLFLCIDPDWMPIEASENANHIGISANYWDIIEKKLGIDVEVYKTATWSGSLEAMKQKKCDVLSFAAPTQKREEYLRFTDALLDLSLVIVTSLEEKNIIDISLLKGKSIAVVKGYAVASVLRERYPGIRLIEVDSLNEGLEKLGDGEVFGFADSAVAIDYAYNNNSYKDFKVSAHFDEKLHLSLAVDKKQDTLYNILQKTVNQITPPQRQDILKKWFFAKYQTSFDYELFWKIVFVVILILFFFIYKHYLVQESNKELKRKVAEELENSKEKDKLIFHQSKLVAMGEMIENIAHQWRQPLSQVNSCVLLIDDKLDEKNFEDSLIEEKLLEIESLTKYMSGTIEDFRNFFDQKKEKGSFYIEEILDKSIQVLQGRIEKLNIKISRGLATRHNCFGYSNELQQALIVIINNAIDIIEDKEVVKGKITIDVNLVGAMNVITISDNAGGITEDLQNKIFEPYYTTKHKSQGTGLGLYIAKVIIEDSLKGELSVKNNFNGATFTIKLHRSEIEMKS